MFDLKERQGGDQEQWVFPPVELTQVEKDEIVATVIKIAVRKMFETQSTHLVARGTNSLEEDL